MNDLDHDGGGGSRARHERRQSPTQPSIERFACVSDVPCSHHRACDLWTSDGAARVLPRLIHHRTNIDWKTERGEPFGHRLHAGDARRALRGKEGGEGFVGRIDEVPEDMDVGPVLDGGDLDAADRLDPPFVCRCGDVLDAGRRVVIGPRFSSSCEKTRNRVSSPGC